MNSNSTPITFNNFIGIITSVTQAATTDKYLHSLFQIKLKHKYIHSQTVMHNSIKYTAPVKQEQTSVTELKQEGS